MASGESTGTVTIFGKTFSVSETTLELGGQWQMGSLYRELSLVVEATDSGGGRLQLDCMPIRESTTIKDLAGARVHFTLEETLPDDTVDSDGSDLDTSAWTAAEEGIPDPYNLAHIWVFEEMTIDFDHLGNNQFHIHVDCLLANQENFDRKMKASGDLFATARETLPPKPVQSKKEEKENEIKLFIMDLMNDLLMNLKDPTQMQLLLPLLPFLQKSLIESPPDPIKVITAISAVFQTFGPYIPADKPAWQQLTAKQNAMRTELKNRGMDESAIEDAVQKAAEQYFS